jgi:hypothetical protein
VQRAVRFGNRAAGKVPAAFARSERPIHCGKADSAAALRHAKLTSDAKDDAIRRAG